MSRAFVKEDIEIPERITRRRSSSGLPPGALNFITPDGARHLQTKVEEWTQSGKDRAEIDRLELTLGSVTIVETQAAPATAAFGTTVTLENASGQMAKHRIVGVDEVHLHPHHVSWVSPLGRALLGVGPGQRISLEGAQKGPWTVVKIE